MNQFGGDWTKKKIEILVEYAKAYLDIMNVYAKRYGWKLLYFDGFAGSGEILETKDNDTDEKHDVSVTIGAARRIIEIELPRPFDEYYFVEKDENNFKELEASTKTAFPKKRIFAVQDDCNKKCLIYQIILETLKTKTIGHLPMWIHAVCK